LDHGDLTSQVWNTGADRRTFALVCLVNDDQVRATIRQSGQELARAVGRAVVNNDELLVERQRIDPLDQLDDRRGLVIRRDEEANSQGHRSYGRAEAACRLSLVDWSAAGDALRKGDRELN
jgi:hypothetical protein